MPQKKSDLGGKKLISLAPDAWVRWVTQRDDIVAEEVFSSEFQWIGRDSDVLVRAHTPDLGEVLVLNELQLRCDRRMPRRVRAYAGLAEEKYDLPVYPVVINILPPGKKTVIPTRYRSQVMGLHARQDYRVINLWEVDATIVFKRPLPALLPFTPILKGGGSESVVRQALQDLRRDAQLSELEPLLAFFATFVLEIPLVQQIMRWDMAILRESPWYQEILSEGEERGKAKGMRKELLPGIELGLELKFGREGLQLLPEIDQIEDLDRLRAIRESLRTVQTLEELRRVCQLG